MNSSADDVDSILLLSNATDKSKLRGCSTSLNIFALFRFEKVVVQCYIRNITSSVSSGTLLVV